MKEVAFFDVRPEDNVVDFLCVLSLSLSSCSPCGSDAPLQWRLERVPVLQEWLHHRQLDRVRSKFLLPPDAAH